MNNIEIPTMGLGDVKAKINALPEEETLAIYLDPRGETREAVEGELKQLSNENEVVVISVNFSTLPHELVALRPSKARVIMDRHDYRRFFALQDSVSHRVVQRFRSFEEPRAT